jgi:hypothetical protein
MRRRGDPPCFHHCIATAASREPCPTLVNYREPSGGTPMLKGEAENMIRRTCEENGKEIPSDEEVGFLAEIIMKIASRIVEEAVANWNTNKPGGKPSYFG